VSGAWSRLGARAIRATMLLDRAYTLFDRARSRVVVGLAGASVLDAHNDLTYGASSVYDAGESVFRTELFNWETEVVRVLPAPPGRILVGGAGGGREAFALAALGYRVTAFEPSRVLARSMAEKARSLGAAVESCVGRYEQLPELERVDDGAALDLRAGPRFDASLLGWASYSHVRTRRERVATLRAFADVTDGPVIFSFYLLRAPRGGAARGRLARVADAIGVKADNSRFTPFIGFYHLSSAEELRSEIAEAGMSIGESSWDDSDGRWPWVAAVRGQEPAVTVGPPPRP